MYTIEIEHQCGCFKKSNYESPMTFETREEMYNKARVLECIFNQEFCFKHFFEAVDYGDKIIIHSTERPDEDEDYDEDEDIKVLMAESKITIGFDEREESPNGEELYDINRKSTN